MTDIRKLVSRVQDVNVGNRYEITLFLPEKLRSEFNLKVDDITFYCGKCSLPGFSNSQIDSRIYGQKRKLGGIRDSNTTCATSYLFDYKGLNIQFFEKWADLIMNPDSKRLGYYNDYIGSMEICVFNNLNDRLIICQLSEVYPIKMNDLSLAYENSELLPLEIEWQYRERKIHHQKNLRGGGTIIVEPIGGL